MTLRAKMALALALLAGLAALLVGVTTYLATEQRVRAEVDASLDSQSSALADPDGNSLRVYCTSRGPHLDAPRRPAGRGLRTPRWGREPVPRQRR